MIYFIGVGNFGGNIASLLAKKIQYKSIPLLFSTSKEDTSNIGDKKKDEIIQIIEAGNGKNFQIGERLWKQEEQVQKLTKYFEPIEEIDKVFICGSNGGGSGSSCFSTFVNILSKRTKKIIVVSTMPQEDSVNFLINSYLSLNSLVELQKKASILLFDNKTILSKNDNNILRANEEIANSVIKSFLVKEIDNPSLKSVWSIDQRDFEEISLKPGFININEVNDLNLKKEVVEFPFYGNLKRIKRMGIVLNVAENVNDKKLEEIAVEFQKKISAFISKFGKNVIIHYGIVRSNFLENGKYYIIGNGFSVNHILMKINAKASIHIQKLKSIEDDKATVTKKEKKDFSFEEI